MSYVLQIYQYTVNDNFSYHVKENKLVDLPKPTAKIQPHFVSYEVDNNG